MKFDYLREFVVFAKHMNFSAAARELLMTQSGLSKHIRQLEDELGAQLVDRRPPMRLTPAGSILLKGGQTILAECDRTVAAVRDAAKIPTPLRVLDMLDDVPGLAEVLRNPDCVPTELVSLDYTNPVVDDLGQDVIEMVFVPHAPGDHDLTDEFAERGFAFEPVCAKEICFCMQESNPLAKKPSLSRTDLIGADLVINAASWFDLWSRMLTGLVGEDQRLTFRLEPVRSAANLRFASYGTSIHPCTRESIGKVTAGRDDLVVFDSLDGKPAVFEWLALFKKDGPQADLARRLAADLRATNGY